MATFISAETRYYPGESQGFTEVPDDIPADVLYVLLSGNNITTLRTNQFQYLSKCLAIFLTQNKITVIQPGAFNGLRSLTELHLLDNNISELRQDMWQGLPSLKILHLGKNYIHSLPRGAFSLVPTLFALELNDNLFNHIVGDWFQNFDLSESEGQWTIQDKSSNVVPNAISFCTTSWSQHDF